MKWINYFVIAVYSVIIIVNQLNRQIYNKNDATVCPISPFPELFTRMAVTFCQYVSYTFTIISTIKISRSIKASNFGDQLNFSMMLLLAGSCVLFIFATVVGFVVSVYFYIAFEEGTHAEYIAQTSVIVTSIIAIFNFLA